MTKKRLPHLFPFFIFPFFAFAVRGADTLVVADFEDSLRPDSILLPSTHGHLVAAGDNRLLRVRSAGAEGDRGIHLSPRDGPWDFSVFAYLEAEVTNHGARPLPLEMRLEGRNAAGEGRAISGMDVVAPGETERVRIALAPTPWRFSQPLDLMGMRFHPGRVPVELDQIAGLRFFVGSAEAGFDFSIDNIQAAGTPRLLAVDDFFPFIDRFGQVKHDFWPGKVRDEWELRARAEAEASALAASDGPVRSRFGGWKNEDYRREATGNFRAEKIDGQWWMVDPDGYLFWSHGVNSVNTDAYTPLDEREHYFADLPGETSALAQFYGERDWAPQGDYRGKGPYRTFNHLRANLYRKFGHDWNQRFNENAHARLEAWGLNTIGNWSDPAICAMGRTAYTLPVHFEDRSRRIEGSEGYWMKFPDMFDPDYAKIAEEALREYAFALDDPYFIGFFVDNELGWGEETYLAESALSSPADQPAKLAFIERLKEKYRTISALNQQWGTHHDSWEALVEHREAPSVERAFDDLADFSELAAKKYFRTNRDVIHAVAPGKLYLGCRFHESNVRAIRAAAAYCDIITINKYAYDLNTLNIPQDIDRPIIIGEFHFGAPDRGVFGPGLKPVHSQAERGSLYANYVEAGLRHPLIVGTHWFLFTDQSTTGRGDGENFQIGMIDVTDTPYGELIEKARQVGHRMYPLRAGLID